jgi:transposase InsO family protein
MEVCMRTTNDDDELLIQGELRPKDRAEEIAIFRAQMIGTLAHRTFERRGELKRELRELSRVRVTPPGAALPRSYSVTTLERWYYAYRAGGLHALRPRPRSDRGHGRQLTKAQRELLLDIRREHPTASVALILRTLVADGRLEAGAVSPSTVCRFYEEQGLARVRRQDDDGRTRRRWEAAHPMALWHADVCHGPALRVGKRSLPLRIHAILDDASRYVVALRAAHTERESEMLALSVQALRRFGRPGAFYLDNGSTYVGDMLATMCARLDIGLWHASPYDPEARGKMERFWRTMREQCLDFVGQRASLHEVQVRLLAWLDQHYHRAPHGGLIGKSPAEVFERDRPEPCVPSEDELRDALTVRARRRVRKDGTLSVGGVEWELAHGYLAGKRVTVARSLLEPSEAPWVEHEDRRLALGRLDPKANATRKRPKPNNARRGVDAVPFDPAEAMLDEATGRTPYHEREDD